MKWKTKAVKIEEKPKYGDKKTKIRFAYIPIKCSKGITVWLERYQVELEYRKPYRKRLSPRWWVITCEALYYVN